MPPSDDDIKELWGTVDEMRAILAKNGMALSRIETLLSERCTIRGKSQDELHERVKALESKLWWMGGAATGAAAALNWFLSHFSGGTHG
jgi:hypothetical protein